VLSEKLNMDVGESSWCAAAGPGICGGAETDAEVEAASARRRLASRARLARLGLEPCALPLRRVALGVLRARGTAAGPSSACPERIGARLVRDRVDAHLGQPLLEVRVPVVLDLVVGALREVRRDRRPPA
jgi:hypothetical protein